MTPILVLVSGGSHLVWRGEFDALLGRGWRGNRGQVAALAPLSGPLWLLIVGMAWANKERFRVVTVHHLGRVLEAPASAARPTHLKRASCPATSPTGAILCR